VDTLPPPTETVEIVRKSSGSKLNVDPAILDDEDVKIEHSYTPSEGRREKRRHTPLKDDNSRPTTPVKQEEEKKKPKSANPKTPPNIRTPAHDASFERPLTSPVSNKSSTQIEQVLTVESEYLCRIPSDKRL
jgi:hypothetical protein